MAQLLDGKLLSEQVLEEIRKRTDILKARGVDPGLAVIFVGDDPASRIYVSNKEKACERTGVRSLMVHLPENATQEELESRIRAFNEDPKVHGILVQLPLPGHLNERHALSLIDPQKDVDGFHILNAGKLFSGEEGTLPCTPRGVIYMLKKMGVPLAGREAVVVGRSNIVGKPTAMLLLRENCTVTLCHSRTEDLKAHTLRADILVVAVGKPGFITADMVKEGAAVVDVGINRINGRVVGDVDTENVARKAAFISPVPGGVGKMTVSMLLLNTVEAAERTLS